MKVYYKLLFFLAFVSISCQKESLVVLENNQEPSFFDDAQLVSLLKGVSAHDGSFDDIIDRSSCFSIKIPYGVVLNGESQQINNIEDLQSINESDEVILLFPIEISFATYQEENISSLQEFENVVRNCANGGLYNDRITCVDFVYPFNVGVFDPATSNFETIVFDHDKKTFQSIDSLNSLYLATIKFPIEVVNAEGQYITIATNESLKRQIQSAISLCE
jgi:hypothetical protein